MTPPKQSRADRLRIALHIAEEAEKGNKVPFEIYHPDHWRIPTTDELEQDQPEDFLVPIRLAPDSEGWIKHLGGACLVDGEELVNWRVRAESMNNHNSRRKAGTLSWNHDNQSTDIIAYRPVQTKPLDFARPPYPAELHNPDNLTPEQVGEGYRLLLGTEVGTLQSGGEEYWSYGWVRVAYPNKFHKANTYRLPISVPWPAQPSVMVDLGPEDVPPGSAVKRPDDPSWCMVGVCMVISIEAIHSGGTFNITFSSLRSDGWLIHRPGDIDTSGKPIWRKCEKEAKV